MKKRRNRPRDANALAKLIVDIAVGEEEDAPTGEKNPSLVERGRKGGLKGGRARISQLSKEERRSLAKKAAAARWSQSSD